MTLFENRVLMMLWGEVTAGSSSLHINILRNFYVSLNTVRKVSQVFNTNPQGSRRRGRPKQTDGGTVYETDIDKCKI